jgi:hypothetical protein
VNADGRLDVSDAILALRAVAHLVALTPSQQAAADANGDGSLAVQDAVLILRSVVRLSSS